MAQTNKSKANQAQKKAQTTPEKTTAAVQQPKSSPKQDVKKQPVNKETYDKFINLKFLVFSGAKLSETAEKEMNKLEAEICKCSGTLPKKTVTAAIDHEVVRMIEGLPLPAEYSEIIKKSKNPSHYIDV